MKPRFYISVTQPLLGPYAIFDRRLKRAVALCPMWADALRLVSQLNRRVK